MQTLRKYLTILQIEKFMKCQISEYRIERAAKHLAPVNFSRIPRERFRSVRSVMHDYCSKTKIVFDTN